jgi:hypothetical protein
LSTIDKLDLLLMLYMYETQQKEIKDLSPKVDVLDSFRADVLWMRSTGESSLAIPKRRQADSQCILAYGGNVLADIEAIPQMKRIDNNRAERWQDAFLKALRR